MTPKSIFWCSIYSFPVSVLRLGLLLHPSCPVEPCWRWLQLSEASLHCMMTGRSWRSFIVVPLGYREQRDIVVGKKDLWDFYFDSVAFSEFWYLAHNYLFPQYFKLSASSFSLPLKNSLVYQKMFIISAFDVVYFSPHGHLINKKRHLTHSISGCWTTELSI